MNELSITKIANILNNKNITPL